MANAPDLEWLKPEHLIALQEVKRRASSRAARERELDRRLDDEQDTYPLGEVGSDEDEAEEEQPITHVDPEALVRKLHSTDPDDQEEALAYLLAAEQVPIGSEMTAELVRLLGSDDDVLRDLAASIIAKVGSSIISDEIEAQIIRLLDNEDGLSWDQATALVSRLGTAIDRPGVRYALDRLSRDADPFARAAAVEAMAELGATQMITGFSDAIVRLLGDSEREVRLSALKALSTTGALSARQDVLAHVNRMLSGEDAELRYLAAEVTAKMRAADVIYTRVGWLVGGVKALAEFSPGTLLGVWRLGAVPAPAGVALGIDDKPIKLVYKLEDASGEFELRITPSDTGPWEIAAQLSGGDTPNSIIVGLGIQQRSKWGSRTVTRRRAQIFFIPPEDFLDLWVHVTWRNGDQTSSVVHRVPARAEAAK